MFKINYQYTNDKLTSPLSDSFIRRMNKDKENITNQAIQLRKIDEVQEKQFYELINNYSLGNKEEWTKRYNTTEEILFHYTHNLYDEWEYYEEKMKHEKNVDKKKELLFTMMSVLGLLYSIYRITNFEFIKYMVDEYSSKINMYENIK